MFIHAEHLQKKYHDKVILDIDTLNIEKGKIYGFVGENGAGKTTLFRVITGLSTPSAGTLERGFDTKRMGIMIETPIMDLGMTAEENLEWMKRVYHGADCKSIPELLKVVKLDQTGKKPVRLFSLGMKQRLGIAMSLMMNPEIIVVDEPMNGLDPEGMIDFRIMLQNINKQGVTILISSHLLGELYKLATDYIFIKRGKIVHTASLQELEDKAVSNYCLQTSNNEETRRILETDYSTIAEEDQESLVFGFSKEKRLFLSKQLADSGIYISEFYEKSFDIEQYYMEIMEK